MRNLFFLLLISASSVWARDVYSQGAQEMFSVKSGTIESIFKQIKKQSDYEFFYNTAILDVKQNVMLTSTSGTLDEILAQVLGKKYEYQVKDNYVLISEKKVFIAESPLYEINAGKETYFAYTESEKAKILSGIKGKYKIQRSKGLGENQPEMMWETTMNPKTRRLIMVTPDIAELTKDKFELLLGENLKGRKEFIESDGYRYLDLADLS